MAEYDRDRHRSLMNVAEDADKTMYARKQYLKETTLKKDDGTGGEAEADRPIPAGCVFRGRVRRQIQHQVRSFY